MRPLTRASWIARFIAHLRDAHGATLLDAAIAAQAFAREHGTYHRFTLLWPSPEDEADYEATFLEGCDEHIFGLRPEVEVIDPELVSSLADIAKDVEPTGQRGGFHPIAMWHRSGGEWVEYVRKEPVPDHMKPPFLVNG